MKNPDDIKLSVCMIARNEEKFLSDCFKSVINIADEIIYVDTGSTDNSINLAKEFNSKIYEIPWENDFSKARNFSIEKATGNYILIIDADERLQNPEILKSTIISSPENIGGWLIEVTSIAKRKNGGSDSYISNLLRLFKNIPEAKFSGIIHEQIIESILQVGLKLESSKIKILHLGYNLDSEQMQQKQIRNLDLLNEALKFDSNHGYNLFQKSKTLLALNRMNEAYEFSIKAIDNLNPEGSVLPQALNYSAIISYHLGNLDEAAAKSKQSLVLIQNQVFANFILGEVCTAKNDFLVALEYYNNVTKAQINPDISARISGDYYLPLDQLIFRLGRTLIALGKINEAEAQFKLGLQINPDEIGCLIGLAQIEFKRNELNSAREKILHALKLEPDNTEFKNYLNQIDLVLNKNISENNNSESENIDISFNSSNAPILTLSMIVRNEEEMLPGCLESVVGIADEIIIVDTGSTDNTKIIAEKYGAKIFDFTWCDDFSAARNEALKNSTGTWILYLDADERIKPESKNKIISLIKNSSENIGAFICTIESNHLQLTGEVELHRGGYPRLFRNYIYPNIYFQGRVHEQITPSIFLLEKSIEFSDIIIEHLGYNKSREVMDGKVRRNYKMLMKHIEEEPTNAYAWYQLGQTLAQMQLFEEAENSIRFSINLGSLSNSVMASATATLAQLVGNKKKFDEANYWCDQSLSKSPDQVYALHLKAFALFYLEKYKESEQLFLEVLKRIRKVKSAPRSGFDIDIPEELILKGLEKTREKLNFK